MFEIGDQAPDFTVTNDQGDTVSLSDYRGKRVLLFFYPKAATSGWTNQANGLRDNHDLIEAGNGVVLGISPDPVADIAKWQETADFPFRLLSDEDKAVANLYGVWGEKKMYGNPFMGVIRSHFVIDADGNFEDIRYKVSPKNSVKYAVASFK